MSMNIVGKITGIRYKVILSENLKKIDIKNFKINEVPYFDYEELVKREGENVFIFLAPPYYSATKSALYGKNKNRHKSFDHEKFAENMKSCKHKWRITYDDSEHIRKWISFANIMPWELMYGMRNVVEGSDQKGKKLFISNYLHQLPQQQTRTLFEAAHKTYNA